MLRPETRGPGFGLFFATNYVAFGVLLAAAGFLLDLTGSASVAVLFDAAILVVFMALVVWFRVLQRPIISGRFS